MNAAEARAHLERVKDLQEAFKPAAVRWYACEVVETALGNGWVWPDEVALDGLAEEDKNCVGSVYRWLVHIGLLSRSAHFRRSEAEGAKGRTIFRYDLVCHALARTFLDRQGHEQPAPRQEEMAL
jgi:hypothetical protein